MSLPLTLELESSSSAIQSAIEEVSRLLEPHLPESERKRLELALDEALRNAFEHGNLGISEGEKKLLCDNGTFEAELLKRSEKARAAGKRTRFELSFDGRHLTCVIEDEGGGFDWRESRDETPNAGEVSGRGLYMIRRLFDRISYNEKGNKIILEKTY